MTSIRDEAEPGRSPVITVEMVKHWEDRYGPIQPGDVVLFYSCYSDAYYKPFPEGQRLTYEPLIAKSSPGWLVPEPAMMTYLHDKGVWHQLPARGAIAFVPLEK